ncbi:MAG TPA: PQQ-binding-like beta-propeller repeat protein [Bryobacteraceae bacterium]|nr:PQQ-binding-like beta-propeller repeat protein [Bryobacteraceae bacterium]
MRKLATLSLFALALHAQTDWPVFGHDPGAMRYSPLKQITPANVSKLKLAWTFDTEAVAPEPASPPGGSKSAPAQTRRPRVRRSESVPLVVNGVLYMSTPYNRVVALEPETGRKIWEYESAHTPALRGIAYWAGAKDLPPQIVFGTADGYLISLNAGTGRPVPGFGEEGLVNLRQGDVTAKYPKARLGMSSPPTIYRGLAITGSSTGEMPQRAASGDVRAWDMRTGKLVWTFHTVPRPGEPNHEAWREGEWENRSGVNSWGLSTLDTERGLLFLPVGTPNNDFYGGDRKGSNLYGSSLVALDAATGKLRWYFQTTHHDNWVTI